MRIYGRLEGTWTEVSTDAQGFNDYVYVTNLIQVLKLSPGESPFFANYGIPAQQSVLTQVFPDYYVTQTQGQFAQFFASLIVAKLDSPTPEYKIDVTTQQGVQMAVSIPV